MMFEKEDANFVSRIVRNARRYISLFADAVNENLPPPTRDISDSQDVLDVLRMSRAQEVAQQRQTEDNEDGSQPAANANAANIFPPALMRRFEVHLIPGVKLKAVPIREVKAAKVGALVRIKGMVTRVSTVKPLLTVATYTCEACAYEVYQEVKETNKAQGRLIMQTKASKFDKYQEVKFQELPDQVPMGHIPRPIIYFWAPSLHHPIFIWF
ncbi:hypothetical protein V7S43_003900 [Phytophthora oleae]|uniref:DNA replication licensing factor MCM7 n=1 Tax=Phytophthora oleae TaxID=2107226 RepID=A0ABD3FUV2_9STRA